MSETTAAVTAKETEIAEFMQAYCDGQMDCDSCGEYRVCGLVFGAHAPCALTLQEVIECLRSVKVKDSVFIRKIKEFADGQSDQMVL